MSIRVDERDDLKLSRRELLGRAARAGLAVPAAAALGALAACGDGGGQPAAEAPAKAPEPTAGATPEPAEPPVPTPTQAPEPAPGAEALVTEIPSNATLVTTLGYVAASPNAEQRCGNCQLYTAGAGGRGKCALFQNGLVVETGWCRSWVQKVG